MQQSSYEQLSTLGNMLPAPKMPQMMNSGRSGGDTQTTHDGITLVGRAYVNSNQMVVQENNNPSDTDNIISWPSRTGGQNNHHAHQNNPSSHSRNNADNLGGSGDKHQDKSSQVIYENRSIPQF